MNTSHSGELVFFWLLFAVVGYLAFSVMSPYITALFLAIVFAILFSPVHRALKKVLKGHENISALLAVIIALVVVMIPLVFLGMIMFQEVFGVYQSLADKNNLFVTQIDHITSLFELQVQKFIPAFEMHSNVASYIEVVLRWIATNLNSFFSGILSFFLECFLIVIAMFFLYRDGKKAHDFAVKWSPLADNYDETIIGKLEVAVSSVVKGALVTAIIQGGLVGIGFVIFGVPNPVLWSVIATITALIPLLGTGIITIPAVLWLFGVGHSAAALGLLIWALGLVGVVDNILRPYLSGRGLNVHPFLILLSVLGGLVYLGPIGFLAGPIILAFFFALLDVYPNVVSGKRISEEKNS